MGSFNSPFKPITLAGKADTKRHSQSNFFLPILLVQNDTFKPSDKAGSKCTLERIYSVAVMEKINGGEEKYV